jgi:leader peptidase (prepilin peptidase) / N-methyltransferase
VLAVALIAASAIDVRERRLPDVITLPLIVLGLSATAVLSPADLLTHVFASAAAYAALWLVATVFRSLRGYDGLGMGDAKLLAGAGAWLGPFYLAPVVLVAAVLGLAAVFFNRGLRKTASIDAAIPFGPFLSVGFFGSWCAERLLPMSDALGAWWT